jgi:hypothetical protein
MVSGSPGIERPRTGGTAVSKEPVSVTGIWLRKSPDHYDGRVEVLAEVDGQWRKAIEYPNPHDGPISHIVEPAGIRNAPPDDLPNK